MEEDLQKELEVALKHLENLALKNLDKVVIDSITFLSQIVLKGVHMKFKEGWIRTVLDRYNEAVFTRDESILVENFINALVKPFFDQSQKGGKIKPPASFWNFMKGRKQATDTERIQKNVNIIISKLSAYATNVRKDLGVIKYFYDADHPERLPIPFAIRGFVEAIRLMFVYDPLSPPAIRIILSIVLAVIDFLDGKSKESLISLAGAFGKNPVLLGLVIKVAMGVFDTNDQESRRSYEAFKAEILKRLTPLTEKILGRTRELLVKAGPLKDQLIDKATNIVVESGPAIVSAATNAATSAASTAATAASTAATAATDSAKKAIEAQAQPQPQAKAQTQPQAQTVQLGGSLPETLAAELYNLIHTNPSVICSRGFQISIESLSLSPLLCLYLEMSGIPTQPRELRGYCESLQVSKISRKTRRKKPLI